LVLLSSDLALMDRWNVHQRADWIFTETIDSSFTLREKHSNSSSKLSCVSLLKHKDGTRTIEMILKSTVLGLPDFPGLIRAVLPTILVVRISRFVVCLKQHHGVFLLDTCHTWQEKQGYRILTEKIFLVQVDPEGSFKHCIAVGISRRLAGYWEKFSISNHHVSVELHRLW
jgi:hypothetical protein